MSTKFKQRCYGARARADGKTSEAAVYRKFINSMKKKTKAMNEEKY